MILKYIDSKQLNVYNLLIFLIDNQISSIKIYDPLMNLYSNVMGTIAI